MSEQQAQAAAVAAIVTAPALIEWSIGADGSPLLWQAGEPIPDDGRVNISLATLRDFLAHVEDPSLGVDIAASFFAWLIGQSPDYRAAVADRALARDTAAVLLLAGPPHGNVKLIPDAGGRIVEIVSTPPEPRREAER